MLWDSTQNDEKGLYSDTLIVIRMMSVESQETMERNIIKMKVGNNESMADIIKEFRAFMSRERCLPLMGRKNLNFQESNDIVSTIAAYLA